MDVTALALALMERLGGPGLLLVIAAEALFPPVPGEVLLPFAGVAAAAEGRSVLWPLGWTTAGSVLGGCAVYGIGRALGEARTRALVRRVPLLEETDVDRAMAFFARWGFPAVALARFVPMVRTVISVPAGSNGCRWVCSPWPQAWDPASGMRSSWGPATCSAAPGARRWRASCRGTRCWSPGRA